MSRYSVVLDACVLVPVSLTDTLLRVAEKGLFRPLWSQRILNEAETAIKRIHPDITPTKITRRFTDMDAAFEDANVVGWEGLVEGFTLPDPSDRHVLAAAVKGRADAVVTFNLRDFPSDTLKAFDLEAIDPDDFLLNQLDLQPREVMAVIREQATAMSNPATSSFEIAARLERASVPEFADEIRRRLERIL